MKSENLTGVKLGKAFHANSLPMALCTSAFVFLDLNKGAEQVLGYSRDELLGKSIMDITAVGDVSFDFQKLQLLLQGEINSYAIKRSYLNKYGEKVGGIISSSVITVEDEQYILGIFYKNVEEMEEMDQLTSDYNLIDKILAINPDIHYIMDIEKRAYVYQNLDILEFFGYNKADVGSGNLIEFLISKIDPLSINEVALANKEFKKQKGVGDFVEVEYRFHTKSDGWKWLRAKSTPLVQSPDNKVKLSYGIIQDVTETKEIEEKLQAQESFIKQVANLAPDVINVYDVHTLKNVYTNLHGKTFLGYSVKEWETEPDVRRNSGYSAHIKASRSKVNSLGDDEVFTDEVQYFTKEGEGRWLLVRAKIFKRDEDGSPEQVLAITTDITDYKRALERLDISQKTTGAVLDAIPDLLLIIDRNGVYQGVFEGVDLKVAEDEPMIGKTLFDILEKHNAEAILRLIQKCLDTGETKLYTFRHEYSDGRPHAYFSNYISKLNDNEVIILARDETTSRTMQLALDEKIKQLSVQNEQMEEFIAKNSELERFAYIISHDLKEPLRSISAIAELIELELRDTPNVVLQKLLNQLIQNNYRMEQLIHGVLEYSRIESDIKPQELDLSEIAEQVVKDLEVLIKERNVKVEIGKLCKVNGDRTQIRQLLQNLISNAIKFNTSEQPLIELGTDTVKGEVVCYVKDNGIGIDDDFKSSIFTMFKRINSYDEFPGQGLGLSICKKIIDRHQGKIWIEDNEYGGSTFYFNFGTTS